MHHFKNRWLVFFVNFECDSQSFKIVSFYLFELDCFGAKLNTVFLFYKNSILRIYGVIFSHNNWRRPVRRLLRLQKCLLQQFNVTHKCKSSAMQHYESTGSLMMIFRVLRVPLVESRRIFNTTATTLRRWWYFTDSIYINRGSVLWNTIILLFVSDWEPYDCHRFFCCCEKKLW